MEGELRDNWALIARYCLRPNNVVARGLDRYIVNGILWVLHSSARWRDLPREYGSPSTCHRRLQEWQDQGIWEHIWLTFLGALDRQGKLDWSQAFLDGSFVPGKKGKGRLLIPMGSSQKGPFLSLGCHNRACASRALSPQK